MFVHDLPLHCSMLTVATLQIPFLVGIQERVRATFTAEVTLCAGKRWVFLHDTILQGGLVNSIS